ncbi:demethylmenaquinone methyltransferase [Scrofimicrobium sp. R131]|uniref:Demethylmenaquinone methyltransferase n=1 Tax=Scrofimicrobium appendicitidis TaxID=3079930 RepID=A0AAU7V700_9ACTO
MTNDPLRADLAKEPSQVASMFNHVASRYDLMNSLGSLGQVHLWRRATVSAISPEPGERILDLAAGTGTSAHAIARTGASVVACDLSPGMIAVGQERYPELEFVEGNATDLPFADDEFDAVTISFGLRNVADVPAALTEMLRVTKPGGRLVIAEFSSPTNRFFDGLYRFYLGGVMPPVARAFSSDEVAYDYLIESILAWPGQQHLGEMIQQSGWEDVQFKNLSGGIVALHRAHKAY